MNLSRQTRKYVYNTFLAAVPVAVYFGILDAEALAVMAPLLLAVLNLSPDDE